jgi:hypothetical protein
LFHFHNALAMSITWDQVEWAVPKWHHKLYSKFVAGVFPDSSVVNVVDVACDDGLCTFFFVEPFKGSHYVVVAVIGNFDELMWHTQGFDLLFYDFEAVENVGFHVNVSDQGSDFVSLLDYFVQCGATVFSSAPVNNNFQAKSTSNVSSEPVLMRDNHSRI